MKHAILLWVTLFLALLTGTSHASHFKGGSLTWEPIASPSGFTVQAHVVINYDSSSDLISDGTGPIVNGRPLYLVGDSVTAGCEIDWNDESGRSSLSQFVVVAVDDAAQIVTLQAVEQTLIEHTYTASGTYNPFILGFARDDEELENRGGTMRLLSSVPVNLSSPSDNRPPAFGIANSNLLIIVKSQPGNLATIQSPVATDADGDTVKYRFISTEAEATEWESTAIDSSWEKQNLQSISASGLISWNTSGLPQTIKTYSIQVVAEDYDTPTSTTPKSRTTIEFQVWVDDKSQTGVPEIATENNQVLFHAFPGNRLEFKIIGTDKHDPEVNENSRLTVLVPSGEMPSGAVTSPKTGFAGDSYGEELAMESVFSWTPALADVGTHLVHFQIQDEDGHLSTSLAVTIIVTAPPGDLVLELSAADDIVVQYGTPISFTVHGSCTTSTVDMALAMEGTVPSGAAFSPVLPMAGTSSLLTTFTWTPTLAAVAADITHFSFILTDYYGRKEVREIYITVTAPPLVLTISPAMEYTTLVHPSVPVVFTVTGSCAIASLPLTLSSIGDMPSAATLTPSLPRTSNGVVSTQFSWTPQFADTNPNGEFLEFLITDGYREDIRVVHIVVAPPPPVVALGSGVLPPVHGTVWTGLSVPLTVTGGTSDYPYLYSVYGDSGTFSSDGTSPLNTSFLWTPIPGMGGLRTIDMTFEDQWGQRTTLPVSFDISGPPAPAWWAAKSVLTGGSAQDFGMATQGQLKAISKNAYEALIASHPEITDDYEGIQLAAYISGLSLTDGNYQPAIQGQVKRAGELFYSVIDGLNAELYIPNPWSNTTDDDSSYAPVTVGQIKSIFSFPIP